MGPGTVHVGPSHGQNTPRCTRNRSPRQHPRASRHRGRAHRRSDGPRGAGSPPRPPRSGRRRACRDLLSRGRTRTTGSATPARRRSLRGPPRREGTTPRTRPTCRGRGLSRIVDLAARPVPPGSITLEPPRSAAAPTRRRANRTRIHFRLFGSTAPWHRPSAGRRDGSTHLRPPAATGDGGAKDPCHIRRRAGQDTRRRRSHRRLSPTLDGRPRDRGQGARAPGPTGPTRSSTGGA